MNPDCSHVEEKSVKVEAWMSKQYEKSLRQIREKPYGSTQQTTHQRSWLSVVMFPLILAATRFERLYNIQAELAH